MTPSPVRRALPPGVRGAPFAAVVLAAALVAGGGCTSEPPSSHGDVLGDSLNGVSAFVTLLRGRGHAVSAASKVTAAVLGDRDVAIVFVDGRGSIDEVASAHLERFLADPGPQSILLAARDGDWAVEYWRLVAGRDELTDGQRRRARENRERAERTLAAWYENLPAATSVARFVAADLVVRGEGGDDEAIDVSIRDGAGGEPTTLSGHWPWRRAVAPGADDRVEWEVGGAALLVRSVDPTDGDTVLVLASDMPLLNAGLVDAGNRRIAEALVDLLPDGAEIAVVGSGEGREGDPDDEVAGNAWRLVTVPPNPWIAGQILLGLLLFCWSRAPIFGRARVRPAAIVRDFGHHVDALGRLLAKGGDTAASAALVAEWERVGRPTAGERGGRRIGGGNSDIQPEARKR